MKALIACILLAAATAFAQEPADTIPYRVKQGDTLGIIAAEHYGDRNKAVFIMVENKITHARPLKPGERLRIPMPRDVTIAPGDTFESLAGLYLGDPKRGPFLAEFNGLSPDDRLAAGTELRVPFTITHTADATESLSSIAAVFFNDAKQGDMLRRYNFLDKSALDKGETVIVPIFNVKVQASKLPPIDADAKNRRNARRDAMTKATTALSRAWQAWRVGDYGRIETALIGIDADYLDTAEAIDVALLRGLAHVADGKTELAVDSFKSALERKPGHVLRKFDYSPKVLALWTQAGGQTE